MTAQTYRLIAYVIVMLTCRFISQSQRKTKPSLLSQSRVITKDWTAMLTALSAAVAIALSIIETTLRETTVVNNYPILAGLAFILTGWGVAYAANSAIGESWSPAIDKTKEQKLVTSGVYAFIRHPLYLSGLLILAGTNIYFRCSWAWFGALLALVVTLIRVPIEERRLVERFGQQYIDYQKRTKTILPWTL
jgi:protein-S-isoprenylcysteine O-methyltransferase Ste14